MCVHACVCFCVGEGRGRGNLKCGERYRCCPPLFLRCIMGEKNNSVSTMYTCGYGCYSNWEGMRLNV